MNILSGYPPFVDIHLCIFGNGYVSSAKLQLLHKKARPPPVPQTTWGLQLPEAIRSNSGRPGIRQCDINIRQTAIYDPACGSGDFLLAAHDYIEKNFSLDKDQKRFLKLKTFYGEDIVDGPVTGGVP